MITPQMKDYILKYIVNNEENRILIKCGDMAKTLNTTSSCIEKIISQFSRLNLCKLNNIYGSTYESTYDITVQAEADDFLYHGGFEFQEEVTLANLKKLESELAYLSKNTSGKILDTVQKAVSIVGALLQASPLLNRE